MSWNIRFGTFHWKNNISEHSAERTCSWNVLPSNISLRENMFHGTFSWKNVLLSRIFVLKTCYRVKLWTTDGIWRGEAWLRHRGVHRQEPRGGGDAPAEGGRILYSTLQLSCICQVITQVTISWSPILCTTATRTKRGLSGHKQQQYESADLQPFHKSCISDSSKYGGNIYLMLNANTTTEIIH